MLTVTAAARYNSSSNARLITLHTVSFSGHRGSPITTEDCRRVSVRSAPWYCEVPYRVSGIYLPENLIGDAAACLERHRSVSRMRMTR